jgi:hypothetical protein
MVSGWIWLAGSQFIHNDLIYWLTANIKHSFICMDYILKVKQSLYTR